MSDFWNEEEVVFKAPWIKVIKKSGDYRVWFELHIKGKKVWEDGYIE